MQQLLMQNEEIGNIQTQEKKIQTTKVQGFQLIYGQTPQLLTKRNSLIRQTALDTFYKIPQAKPILSKQYIDFNKPKVLIKEIPMYKEPQQLIVSKISHHKQELSANLQNKKVQNYKSENKSTQKNIKTFTIQNKETPLNTHHRNNQYLHDRQENDQIKTTIWQKYLARNEYECLYVKYLRESTKKQIFDQKIQDPIQRKQQNKKIKLELLKMCRNNQNLFNTYFIDLDFITEAGTTLIRNLNDCTLNNIFNKWKENKNLQESLKSQYFEFESRFECGNLFSVFRKIDKKTQNPIEPRSFDLILQNDINTKGYTNWFYFSIKSRKKGRLRFNIVNMYKKHSLYNQGMKLCVFSYQRLKNEGIEWVRDGSQFSYNRNQLLKYSQTNEKYSTLSFSLQQRYDDDILFIAANFPYSYSKLVRYLDSIQKVGRLNSNIYIKRQNHITSISSNSCPLLTLTWKRDKNQKNSYKKKIIAIIARQHPCETVSSYVMEGIINSLVYISNEASAQLLKKYIFKIIPMFNVDGVIYGNARCDISGTDVNRKWTKSPNSFLYPVIKGTKKLYHELLNENYEIDYFIDLHGHSKNLGTFLYSCKGNDPVQSRIFTWIMSKISQKFALENCIFSLAKNKKETARGSMANLVNSKKSFTVQTSFFGWKKFNSSPIKHFQIKDLHEIGQSLLTSIYADQGRDPKLYNWNLIKNQIKAFLDSSHSIQSQEQYQSGSDSNPSYDEMTLEEKTNSFLPSNTATKIGLVQAKIVQKSLKSKSKAENIQRQPSQNIQAVEGFDLPDIQQPQSHDSHIKQFFSNRLVHNNFEPKIKQSKSVTKVSPFKFSQRQRKSFSTKKIKIAIDIKYFEQNKQKMSIPSLLPQIQEKKTLVHNQKMKRKNFWSNFNRQLEKILKEREKIISDQKIQIINKDKFMKGNKPLK